MIVLSLFDGLSCGRIAFEREGIHVNKYYSSEIDKFANQVSQANYPDIIRLGDITKWREWDIEQPDIIIGGTPCQNFSFAGKRKGMSTQCEIKVDTLEKYLELKKDNFEFEGQSYLFWEYVSILRHYKPKYFLLENVRMTKDWENIISLAVGIQPVLLNSSLVSAQNRQRLYWTNINAKKDLFGGLIHGIEQPEDKKIYLKDIIEDATTERNKSLTLTSSYYMTDNVENYFKKKRKQLVKCGRIIGRPIYDPKSRVPGQETKQMLEIRDDEKTNCLSTVQKDNVVVLKNIHESGKGQNGNVYGINGKSPTLCSGGKKSGILSPKIETNDINWRKLTPIECERLQTIDDEYTSHVSNSQRYKMLGNGWTVDIIAHILEHINLSK